MERLQVGHGLLCRAEVGFRDNLQKWGASAIEVNAGLMSELVVDRLSGILFQMGPGNANWIETAVFQWHFKNALADDRGKKLTHLISLGKVGVEVVFPIEDGSLSNSRADSQAKCNGVSNGFLIKHRQHTGHAKINGIGLHIR